MHEDERFEDKRQGDDVSHEGQLVEQAGDQGRVPSPRTQLTKQVDLIRELAREGVFLDGDGWSRIDIHLTPKAGLLVEAKATAIALAKRQAVRVYITDLHQQTGEVVWCDQEYVSLDYGGTYNVWKRAELGLL